MIKVFVMDVDGTLTDGKIYIGLDGELMKAFSVKDGLGISKLHSKSIVPAIITGRISKIVEARAEELNIIDIYQGIDNKIKKLEKIAEKYNCDFSEIAYIGDDENDLECMKLCGIKGCPSDAVDSVKEISDFVSNNSGGNGAVREFIEYLLNTQH